MTFRGRPVREGGGILSRVGVEGGGARPLESDEKPVRWPTSGLRCVGRWRSPASCQDRASRLRRTDDVCPVSPRISQSLRLQKPAREARRACKWPGRLHQAGP
jgi:hypothetical protein